MEYYGESWHDIEQWGIFEFLFKIKEMNEKIKERNASLKKSK